VLSTAAFAFAQRGPLYVFCGNPAEAGDYTSEQGEQAEIPGDALSVDMG